MAKNKSKSNNEAVPFEDALEQLKSIVGELENGNLSLSVSLEKYEQGVKYLKDCYQSLESAQKRIEILVRIDEDGKLITQPFDDAATHPPTRESNRTTGYSDAKGTVKTSVKRKYEDNSAADAFEESDKIDPNSLF